MAVSAEEALLVILKAHFGAVSSPPWTDYQPESVAAAKTAKPYMLFFVASALNERQLMTTRHERITLSAKGVALTLSEAWAVQETLSVELDDSGSQDVGNQNGEKLPSHANWDVLTVTEDGIISLDERFEGAQAIYHRGHRFDILMERKTS